MPRQKSARQPSVVILGTRGYPSYYGGFETAVRKIAPHLVDSGWDVSVFGRPGWVKYDDPARDRRVRSVTSWGINTRALSTLTYSLSATIYTAFARPSVALIMNVANGLWIPLLWLMRIPTLVHVDGIEWERGKWGHVARAVFKIGAAFTKRFATGLIYDAKEIARIWEALYGRSGYHIAYGGDEVPEHEVPLGLKSGQYALLVARFVPENSIQEFIEAVRAMPDVPVVFVGSSGSGGEIEREVEELAEQRGNVRWLGHVQDDVLLFALWQHAGAYFHGHTVGGTNPALVQAMAASAAIVAVHTPFNSEVLADAGLLTEATPTSIATSIRRVLVDGELRAELQNKAKRRALSHFSWQAVCEGYRAALEDTMARGPRRVASLMKNFSE